MMREQEKAGVRWTAYASGERIRTTEGLPPPPAWLGDGEWEGPPAHAVDGGIEVVTVVDGEEVAEQDDWLVVERDGRPRSREGGGIDPLRDLVAMLRTGARAPEQAAVAEAVLKEWGDGTADAWLEARAAAAAAAWLGSPSDPLRGRRAAIRTEARRMAERYGLGEEEIRIRGRRVEIGESAFTDGEGWCWDGGTLIRAEVRMQWIEGLDDVCAGALDGALGLVEGHWSKDDLAGGWRTFGADAGREGEGMTLRREGAEAVVMIASHPKGVVDTIRHLGMALTAEQGDARRG